VTAGVLKMLVMDDAAKVREMIPEDLALFGHAVLQAADELEALLHVKRGA